MKTREELQKIRKGMRADEEKNAKAFSALGDPRRLTIVKLLLTNEGICVSEIAEVCDITVAAASQHLQILESAGLIKRRRDGQMTCYKIESGNIHIKALKSILK